MPDDERKPATPQALRQSEGRLRAVFQQAAVGMAISSLDGIFEEVNDRFCKILGYEDDELVGKSFLKFTFREDLETTNESVRQLLAGEVANYAIEKRYVRKQGDLVWCLTSVTTLRGLEGQPEKFIGVIEDITQRKRAEAAVWEGAQRFQLALTAGQLGEWSWDPKTDIVTTGPKAADFLGIPPGPAMTWTQIRERLHPSDRERARLAVEESLATHSDYNIEYRIYRGASLAWIAAKGRGVYAADGTVTGMIGVVQDITQSKQEVLSQSRLAAVVESSDDAIISIGLDTIITTWNRGAQRMFGYTAEEAIGKSVAMLIPPDSEDEEPKIVQRILDGNRVDHYETIRMRKDGSLVNVSLSVSPVRDAEGKIIGISKILRDISDWKQVEESRSRLAAVVESSDDAIISMNLDTTITSWNQGAEQTFGYTATEVVGKSVSILIPPDSEDEEPKILQRILDGERVDHYETIRMRKDGTLLDVSLTVSPVLDSTGKIRGVSKISRDITEKKRAEEALRHAQEELRRHAETLEEQVADRTARLRETIQELEAFSYSVSHDMRSPLRAMQGYSDALLEDHSQKLDETAQDYLKRIRRAALRMDMLIQDVLAYSRVAKGDIDLQPVDAEHVIADVIQHYPALEPKNADIRVIDTIPKVIGHEAYLTQIISNLLSNAVKFVPAGTRPAVNIRAKREGEMVRIIFTDNGIGIAPEHQKQIFQIFGRVYSEKKFEGTGIGLAIAKKAAERMGGSIGVESKLGGGSEFFVLLKEAQ